MSFRWIWIIFAVFLITLVPLKILGAFFTLTFVESTIFLIIFSAAIICTMILASFIKMDIRNIDIKQNIWLGILSLLIAASFFWCAMGYRSDTSKYDFTWQPFILSTFAILSCITFILSAATFFSGKNILAKASFFIFCPVLWLALNMILFLSIYNNNVNVYDVLLMAFLALFFVYHTQVFSTSSNSNIAKLMFVLGIPTIILALIKCVPILIKFINHQNVSNLSASTCTVEILLALYIFVTLLNTYKQSQELKNPVIKSTTL